jgi:hypothetical protein
MPMMLVQLLKPGTRLMRNFFCTCCLALVLLAPLRAHAQGISTSPGVSDPTRWGFFFNLGIGDQTGDFADQLQKGTTGEFGLVREKGDWRTGLALSFGSWGMVPPYDHELEWGFQRIDVLAQRMFNQGGSFRPYLEGRLGIARLHPRSELFDKTTLPDDYKVGDSTTSASDGWHVGLMPGLEWDLNKSIALDLSLYLDYYKVQETNLTPVGGPKDASTGFDWSARLGVLWWTDGGPGSTPEYDAWGVRKSYGWAIGEMLAINLGASAFNEYVRNANFNQISPRSWWKNIEHGLTYDDNQFKTNQFIHPFNGSQYYNSARANGVSYWPSYGVGILGAAVWEYAGETHPPSFNDMISTGIGGAAVGETQYRFSSMLLDNTSVGMGRFWREAGGFLIDPVRGFNRILSGQAWKVRPNPEDEMDKNVPNGVNDLAIGWRRSGNGTWPSLEHDYTDYTWVRYLHEHGSVFDNSRRKPWDYFDSDLETAFGEKNKLIRVNLTGNWWTTSAGDPEKKQHVLAFTQHFEYENTNAYEYGGQSIGPSFFSRWGAYRGVSLDTRFDILATLLGAVNSDYSDSLAVVAEQERFREYDYGPGAGGKAELKFGYHGQRVLTADYRIHFLNVTNGSIYSGQEAGLNAKHWLHGVDLRADSPPLHRDWGVGVEYKSFTRQSHYQITLAQLPGFHISQIVTAVTPEFLLYVRYSPGSHKEK